MRGNVVHLCLDEVDMLVDEVFGLSGIISLFLLGWPNACFHRKVGSSADASILEMIHDTYSVIS